MVLTYEIKSLTIEQFPAFPQTEPEYKGYKPTKTDANYNLIFKVCIEDDEFDVSIDSSENFKGLCDKIFDKFNKRYFIRKVKNNSVLKYLLDNGMYYNILCKNRINEDTGVIDNGKCVVDHECIINYLGNNRNKNSLLLRIAKNKDNHIMTRSLAIRKLGEITDTSEYIFLMNWLFTTKDFNESLINAYVYKTHKYYGDTNDYKSLITEYPFPLNSKDKGMLSDDALQTIIIKHSKEFNDEELDWLFKYSIHRLYSESDYSATDFLDLMIMKGLCLEDYYKMNNPIISYVLIDNEKYVKAYTTHRNKCIRDYAISTFEKMNARLDNDNTENKLNINDKKVESYNYQEATSKAFLSLISDLYYNDYIADALIVTEIFKKYLKDCDKEAEFTLDDLMKNPSLVLPESNESIEIDLTQTSANKEDQKEELSNKDDTMTKYLGVLGGLASLNT